MSSAPSASEPWQRLHPSGALMWFVLELKRSGLAFLPILLTDLSGGRRGSVVLAFLTLLVVVATVRHLRFRYALASDSMLLEGGALFRWRRVIPKARVQSVEVVQKLRHRLFGVVELRIEVVGGDQTEGALVAVRPEEAERVRAAIVAPTEEQAVREAPPLVRLTPGELVLAGVTGGRVPVLFVLLTQFGDLLPEDFDPSDQLARRAEGAGVSAVALAVAVVAGLLFLTLMLSLLMTVLVYWDFTIKREGDRLLLTRGLFDKRRTIVPLRRIQNVRIHENIVRRLLGMASLTVTVAGFGGGGQEVERSSMLLPIGRRGRALQLASGLLRAPEDVGGVFLEPAPRRALRRRLIRAVVGTTAITGAIVAGTELSPVVMLVSLPFAVAYGWASWRALGHALGPRTLFARSGVFDRVTTVVPVANVQVLEVRSSPFQRMNGLAALRVRVPRGSKGVTTAEDLDRARAEERFGQVQEAMA